MPALARRTGFGEEWSMSEAGIPDGRDPEDAGAPIEEGFVIVGPGPVHYVLQRAPSGSAGADLPPLVFLHEGLGSIGLWRGFPHEVRTALGHPTTLVYSRHGYGRSAVVPGPRAPGYMHVEAQVVLPELLAAFGLVDPVLVGHSDGASIALLHAGSGGSVRALVVIAPHVFVESCTLQAIAEARDAFRTTDLPARLGRHHQDAWATFHGWNDVWLSDGFRDWNIASELPAISAPVLLLQGENDPYGTLAQLDAIAAGVAGKSERVIIAAAGHSPHLEAGPACRDAIVAFLLRNPGVRMGG
jgi:pimeloyl-ACP methyl ester carboxylesterase